MIEAKELMYTVGNVVRTFVDAAARHTSALHCGESDAPQKRFLGARVVITGAGSGIGKAIAKSIVAEGGRVALWGLHKTNVQELADALNDTYGSAQEPVAFPFRVDVAQARAVERTSRETIRALHGVNVVVNNAGIISGKSLKQLDDRDIRQTFGVNSMALFWVTKAFLGELERHRRARIVNIASVAGFVSVAGQSDYSASKFAAVGFTNALRAELRHTHSSVSTLLVCPYYISTGMFTGVDAQISGHAMRMLTTEEVSQAIVDAIATDKERLFIPKRSQLVTMMAALPVRIADRLLEGVHANDAMTHFVGKHNDEQND